MLLNASALNATTLNGGASGALVFVSFSCDTAQSQEGNTTLACNRESSVITAQTQALGHESLSRTAPSSVSAEQNQTTSSSLRCDLFGSLEASQVQGASSAAPRTRVGSFVSAQVQELAGTFDRQSLLVSSSSQSQGSTLTFRANVYFTVEDGISQSLSGAISRTVAAALSQSQVQSTTATICHGMSYESSQIQGTVIEFDRYCPLSVAAVQVQGAVATTTLVVSCSATAAQSQAVNTEFGRTVVSSNAASTQLQTLQSTATTAVLATSETSQQQGVYVEVQRDVSAIGSTEQASQLSGDTDRNLVGEISSSQSQGLVAELVPSIYFSEADGIAQSVAGVMECEVTSNTQIEQSQIAGGTITRDVELSGSSGQVGITTLEFAAVVFASAASGQIQRSVSAVEPTVLLTGGSSQQQVTQAGIGRSIPLLGSTEQVSQSLFYADLLFRVYGTVASSQIQSSDGSLIRSVYATDGDGVTQSVIGTVIREVFASIQTKQVQLTNIALGRTRRLANASQQVSTTRLEAIRDVYTAAALTQTQTIQGVTTRALTTFGSSEQVQYQLSGSLLLSGAPAEFVVVLPYMDPWEASVPMQVMWVVALPEQLESTLSVVVPVPEIQDVALPEQLCSTAEAAYDNTCQV